MSNPPDPPPEQSIIPRPQATIAPTTETDLTPAADTAPVKSYAARWLGEAGGDLMAWLKLERSFSGITGLVMLLLSVILLAVNGVTWTSVLPIVVSLSVLLITFTIFFFRAPAKLDKGRQSEIGGLVEESRALNAAHAAEIERLKVAHQAAIAALDETHGRELQALQTELASLQAGFYEVSNFLLRLDVDTTQTRARVDDSVVGCHIFIGIRLRFDNGDDKGTLTVKDLSLTPYERSDTGDVRELDCGIPSIHYNHFSFFLDDNFGELAARRPFEQLPVESRKVTPYYWIKADIAIATLKNTDLIKGKHFLRLTMLATNQLPFIIDIDVDWRKAMFGFTPVSISHPHAPRT